MDREVSVQTQKAAYFVVEQEKVRARDIKVLVSQYGKTLGKDRLERVAGVLSDQLTTVVASLVWRRTMIYALSRSIFT